MAFDIADRIGTRRVLTRIVVWWSGFTIVLSEIAERDDWGIPSVHILEFITEQIGLDALEESQSS